MLQQNAVSATLWGLFWFILFLQPLAVSVHTLFPGELAGTLFLSLACLEIFHLFL